MEDHLLSQRSQKIRSGDANKLTYVLGIGKAGWVSASPAVSEEAIVSFGQNGFKDRIQFG